MSIQDKIGIKEAIHKKIVERKALDTTEAYAAMRDILLGNATPAQVGAFLVALKVHEPGVEEVTSLVRCMKDFANKIHPINVHPVVDTCGTGGDALKTINISTLAALVAAGAGVTIAKHGNRSVTSACGSADILEHLGVNIMASPATVEQSINNVGIGFMFAPVFHPAMKHAAGPRKEIGLRTVFNVLGPLTNPAGATGQVLGVYDENLATLMANALMAAGVKRFFIVHNEHGADELLPAGKNHVHEGMRNGTVKELVLGARDFGLPEASLSDLVVSNLKEAGVQVFIDILKNSGPGALVDAVLMNSALAIIAGGLVPDFKEATRLARASLESGAALGKLRQLVKESGGSIDRFERRLGGTVAT
ncbi:MAG: anthranilate phosphoribosyltransferase [Candidatus Lokiarchaeota archaeon]|nr:anthranilate phosphoribosyltransferase [Candidatus Lokiarchaeota archaeon]